jgi:hypothetical protein
MALFQAFEQKILAVTLRRRNRNPAWTRLIVACRQSLCSLIDGSIDLKANVMD